MGYNNIAMNFLQDIVLPHIQPQYSGLFHPFLLHTGFFIDSGTIGTSPLCSDGWGQFGGAGLRTGCSSWRVSKHTVRGGGNRSPERGGGRMVVGRAGDRVRDNGRTVCGGCCGLLYDSGVNQNWWSSDRCGARGFGTTPSSGGGKGQLGGISRGRVHNPGHGAKRIGAIRVNGGPGKRLEGVGL